MHEINKPTCEPEKQTTIIQHFQIGEAIIKHGNAGAIGIENKKKGGDKSFCEREICGQEPEQLS